MPRAAPAPVGSAASSSTAASGSNAAASSSFSSSRPGLTRPVRLTSSGSFHAGAPIPAFPTPYGLRADPSSRRRSTIGGLRRQQSTHKYHTFPTQPPKTPSDAPDSSATLSPTSYSDGDGGDAGKSYWGRHHGHRHTGSRDSNSHATPLPVRQLALLALLSICEQTALNSIGPYLPNMVASFPEIPDAQVGLYVGLLASSFALAQLLTNFLWGYFSDRVGRKPVMLVGTALLMVCFAFFGFCQRYWQVMVVHIAMGLLNGNAAVVPTVLGELTDRSNQSRAFTWLPVMYSLGGITGPALGGLLVGEVEGQKFPYLGPNVMSAAALLLAVVVLAIWFQETLEDVQRTRPLTGLGWVEKLYTDQGEDQALLHASTHPDIESQDHANTGDGVDYSKDSGPSRRSTLRQLLNWTTLSILFTYLIFQVANISFNSLYPIFASAAPPTGRDLGPGTIGVSMSLAGLVTIVFQISLFERIKARLGNLGTFRLSLLGLALCMILIPWVGYQDQRGLFGWTDGRSSLLAELGVILVLKNLSAVGGLSCALLLITNSAPSHETLGTLNGIAQTLSAAGRSFGPFTSGAVFTLSARIRPKGELLAWGLFGGVALLGWLWTLAIKGDSLESEDFVGEDDDEDTHGSEADDPVFGHTAGSEGHDEHQA
ncbi:MFS general substrate transporter [Cryphonectria parasitica EP155]|uniref:MFS general substrate transporter n=1 Tax=Cryphonectria parasitica (strain ATCC 38755 / EP155) TaxID=660469 RepID=A0A9P5CNJ4_CRYP1|nr:MFS general substrate transporter [Cryphonectria parasitica EP155]KAF3765198.1 MFS general substrate transporter [Cryphonectria parasitica EP155]